MGSSMAEFANDQKLSVTVFTTGPSCQRCRLMKMKFDSLGVPYREVDVRESDQAASFLQEKGYAEAPVVVVPFDWAGPREWSGFRPDLAEQLAAG